MEMMRLPLLVALIAALACTSCRSLESEDTADSTPVCRECFDAVVAARKEHPAASADEHRVIEVYTCPCCNAEMAVYIEGGVHMVRCGGLCRTRCRVERLPPRGDGQDVSKRNDLV